MNRWNIPVLTQVILILMEYNINLKPRFHVREEVALGLASYLAGLSSWRTTLPHSTLLYYYKRLGSVKYVVSLSLYAIDETKVVCVRGNYYYVWIVRDVVTKAIPFFIVTSLRSGFHVLIVLVNMRGIEEIASRYFKRIDRVIYLHDGLPAYNAFDWFNVGHKWVTFGRRDYAEQGFRTLKHRLSSMDFHFPWSSNRLTITSWLSTFFLIYNILYTQVYLVDRRVIINANISNA
ncbi:IS6 family transposase [Sulfolobus sp. E11-6]|nr:IS6 family transposase [Sulfolobus sp. E11-6]QGA69685.1 IS6 family transposase [Sulfolobus sp. E11-6]